jgi:hypothetical protein
MSSPQANYKKILDKRVRIGAAESFSELGRRLIDTLASACIARRFETRIWPREVAEQTSEVTRGPASKPSCGKARRNIANCSMPHERGRPRFARHEALPCCLRGLAAAAWGPALMPAEEGSYRGLPEGQTVRCPGMIACSTEPSSCALNPLRPPNSSAGKLVTA